MSMYDNAHSQNIDDDKSKSAKKSEKSDKQHISNISKNQQPQLINKQTPVQIHAENNVNHDKLKQQYYDFFKFKDFISDPQNYIPKMPTDDEFKKHKIKYLKGNQFYQQLQSYGQTYIRVKNTQKSGTIVNYNVIITMFELEITLLNIDENAKEQQNKIGKGTFGSVRVQSQNNRMFAVKRQMFKNKYHLTEFNMMANKQEINKAITQMAIYKICSLLKIGPTAETQIGFDLICYKDCIQFQIQYCLKIEYPRGIIVDLSKFEKQIKQCLLKLHFYQIIHKDIKPANILFSITYNKYVFTDFGISHPIVEKIGYRSNTHCKGTFNFMSKQMLQIGKGNSGLVHLYGNDVYSLILTLRKQMNNQNIEQTIEEFDSKLIKQSNKNYEYQYLKLKYYCIKPNSKINEVQKYWKYMNTTRRQQLIEIVDKSIEYLKINSVYNYLSKSQEFNKCKLKNLRIQSQSIKNIKINLEILQNTQLYLKNILRIYGYNQQVKDMIIKMKLEQKYKGTLQQINKLIDEKKIEVNYRDRMFDNHVNYIKKVKNQIQECQQTKNYGQMFKKFMIILQYGNMEEQKQTIQRLKMLNYQRNQQQNIEQMIRICKIEKNRQKLEEFIQWMNKRDQGRDKVITEEGLYSDVANIYNYAGKYNKAIYYYDKRVQMDISLHGQQHPSQVSYIKIWENMSKHYNTLLRMQI